MPIDIQVSDGDVTAADKKRMTRKLQRARDIIFHFLDEEFDCVDSYDDGALDNVLAVLDNQIESIRVYE